MSFVVRQIYKLVLSTSFLLSGRFLSSQNWFWLEMFMDQSSEPLHSPKAREFGEFWRENCTRAPWTFPFNWTESVLFGGPYITDKLKATKEI